MDEIKYTECQAPHIFFDRECSINDFDIGRRLGAGQMGKVYRVFLKSHKYVLALKMIKKEELTNETDLEYINREISIQNLLSDDNIVKLYGHFQDEKRIFLMLEYCRFGSIADLLKIEGKFCDTICATYMHQVGSALSYMHELSILHRDIKPGNLLLCRSGQMKLADFGSSVQHREDFKRTKVVGTVDYIPPEMVLGIPYDCKIDIWSLAAVLYELLTGKPPFYSRNQSKTLYKIKSFIYIFPVDMNSLAVDFIKMIFQYSESRPTATEVLKSDYVQQFSEGNLEECKAMQTILEKIRPAPFNQNDQLLNKPGSTVLKHTLE